MPTALAPTMADLVIAWDRDARDSVGPKLTMYAADADLPASDMTQVVTKRHSCLVFDWGTSGASEGQRPSQAGN
ncbi:hypothetical protein [Streptomyces wuyuanensis]|uniref:hypothetical protein n=1 Tax=Streptomyces wuyuanensis TaxID=1196353 RepID=UPI0037117A87